MAYCGVISSVELGLFFLYRWTYLGTCRSLIVAGIWSKGAVVLQMSYMKHNSARAAYIHKVDRAG
jgi:hypothetical protein